MSELLEIKNDILKVKSDLECLMTMLAPQKLSEIARITGKNKETIRLQLINEFEPEVDYKMKDGTIIVSNDVATKLILRNRAYG